MIPFSDPVSAASFEAGNIIDESKFTASSSMTATDIQVFLNARNSVCLKDYQTPEPLGNNQYGGNVSAAQAIWNSGHLYGISPKVLLATLQKEQGLVTRSDCPDWRYRAAMGFGCPDSAPCDEQWYGLSKQLYQGARHLKGFYDQSPGWYIPYRPGNRFVQYSPNSACGGTTVNIQNRSTASLYSYTPYQPNAAALAAGYGTGDGCSAYGNRNFWLYYTAWFGPTTGDYCYGATGPVSQGIQFRKYDTNVDTADLLIYSGSSTNCIESHVWNRGMQNWRNHTATNQISISYPNHQVLYGDLDGSGRDYPLLFGVAGTSTGKIESHVWNRDMKSWLAHTASNQAVIDPADCKIIVADLEGERKDQVILACLRNTSSGKIELHKWNPGMQTWAWHNITNMPAVDPALSTVVAGDTDGNGTDELVLVALGDTGSGKIEFHVWNPGYWSWKEHIASNMTEIDHNNANVQFADTDGNGIDEAVLVAPRNTGSGKIEFHVWNPGYWSWKEHIASNHPSL